MENRGDWFTAVEEPHGTHAPFASVFWGKGVRQGPLAQDRGLQHGQYRRRRGEHDREDVH